MATVAQQQAFITQMEPYARQAGEATGWDAGLILAQWANETAWGTAMSTQNNFGNIGNTTSNPRGGAGYPSIEAGVQAYINYVNSSSYLAGVKAAGSTLAAQAKALGESGWAAGKYTNGGGPGSSLTALVPTVQKFTNGRLGTVSPATGSATGSWSGAASSGASAGTTTNATGGPGAAASIDAILKAAGLGTLVTGATALARTLTAQGASATDIAASVTTWLQTQPAFDAKFPGMKQRTANGHPAIGITTYLAYETQAQQMARAAGLPTGFMSTTEIGNLIANDVSPAELSTRITKGYQAAMSAPPETRDLLASYYGVNTGTLASYFLTPKNSITKIQNAIASAQIGGEAKASGFTLPKPTFAAGAPGQPLTALYLAQLGVSQASAEDTFQSLAKLEPLMKGLPGTGAEKTSLSQNDLLNYGFFGTNAQELQNVEEARTAPFHGGGGYVQSARGVLGAGFGSSQGQQGT